jgi:S1-C subfamily serine protease
MAILVTEQNRDCCESVLSRVRIFIFALTSGAFGFIQQAQADMQCGWIGAGVTPITKAFAISLDMAVPHGAIIKRPEPAARSKIRAGDVVTRINGIPLTSSRDFQRRILTMATGTRVHLRVFRNRQPIMFTVRLGSTKCPRESGS